MDERFFVDSISKVQYLQEKLSVGEKNLKAKKGKEILRKKREEKENNEEKTHRIDISV